MLVKNKKLQWSELDRKSVTELAVKAFSEAKINVIKSNINGSFSFVVYDVDMFGEPNFIGQYTVPVRCLRTGFRSVPLKNNYCEEIELCGNHHLL